ncbi:MAG: hypothetical protein KTR31_36720 [Myxococcales bacterium]|nr:hypothetical protein [Myxococcales bacterium]
MNDRRLRVGINGLGRIGRAVARILAQRQQHRIVHVNDLNTDVNNLAYLLKYDTTYGRLDQDVRADAGRIRWGDNDIHVSHVPRIDQVDWAASEVDVVIEATGVADNETAAHTVAKGTAPVFVTHAAPSADFTLVFGATDRDYDPAAHKVVSTSICDAIAAAPVLKTLNEAFGVASGFVTTLHPWLSYQNLMDGPSRSQSYPGATYSHYPLGRSSIGALIPKPTTVVKATERILPEIAGRLQCFSYRVPTPCVSSGDLTLQLERSASKAEVIEALTALEQSQGDRKVIRITEEPLISVDYLKDEHSCIIDTRWLMTNHDRHLKVVLWYDNEWGYSSRVVDALDLLP